MVVGRRLARRQGRRPGRRPRDLAPDRCEQPGAGDPLDRPGRVRASRPGRPGGARARGAPDAVPRRAPLALPAGEDRRIVPAGRDAEARGGRPDGRALAGDRRASGRHEGRGRDPEGDPLAGDADAPGGDGPRAVVRRRRVAVAGRPRPVRPRQRPRRRREGADLGAGRGALACSPIRTAEGVSLEVRADSNSPPPTWSPVATATGGALIEVRGGDLVLSGVRLWEGRNAKLEHLVRVDDGHLVLDRCRLTAPGGVRPGRGGLVAFRAAGTRPFERGPGPSRRRPTGRPA